MNYYSAASASSLNSCALSDIFLDENYAWVDAKLERDYYDSICIEDDCDLSKDYDTFAPYVDETSDEQDSDFSLLIRDIQNIIVYHQDRRRRRLAKEPFHFMPNDEFM
jgi:hypothetical protein